MFNVDIRENHTNWTHAESVTSWPFSCCLGSVGVGQSLYLLSSYHRIFTKYIKCVAAASAFRTYKHLQIKLILFNTKPLLWAAIHTGPVFNLYRYILAEVHLTGEKGSKLSPGFSASSSDISVLMSPHTDPNELEHI